MNLCSDGHEEICYDSKSCPLCEKIAEMAELQKEINRLQEELDNA